MIVKKNHGVYNMRSVMFFLLKICFNYIRGVVSGMFLWVVVSVLVILRLMFIVVKLVIAVCGRFQHYALVLYVEYLFTGKADDDFAFVIGELFFVMRKLSFRLDLLVLVLWHRWIIPIIWLTSGLIDRISFFIIWFCFI